MLDPSPITILEQMAARPGMYWGNSDNDFHSFTALLVGMKLAEASTGIRSSDLVPEGFSQFVFDHFNESASKPAGTDWSWIIQKHTSSPSQAMTKLVELRRRFESQT